MDSQESPDISFDASASWSNCLSSHHTFSHCNTLYSFFNPSTVVRNTFCKKHTYCCSRGEHRSHPSPVKALSTNMHFFRLLLMAKACLSLPCLMNPCPWITEEVKATQPTNTSMPARSIPASHLAAAAAGIDIDGEIPSDYLHKNGSAYHFAPGSNASIWVRAQIDKPWAPPNETLSKRQVGSVGHLNINPLFPSPSRAIKVLTASSPIVRPLRPINRSLGRIQLRRLRYPGSIMSNTL
jgi:hypothetical protein